jgi:hypothetical protein
MNKQHLELLGRKYEGVDPFDRCEMWSWFGTLTYRDSISNNKACRVYTQWFEELERKQGRPNSVDFVCIDEEGSFDGNSRIHVLMGGSRIRCKWDWMLRWVELGGDDALIWYYRPGFLSYVLNTVNDDSELEVYMAINGSLWIFDDWF